MLRFNFLSCIQLKMRFKEIQSLLTALFFYCFYFTFQKVFVICFENVSGFWLEFQHLKIWLFFSHNLNCFPNTAACLYFCIGHSGSLITNPFLCTNILFEIFFKFVIFFGSIFIFFIYCSVFQFFSNLSLQTYFSILFWFFSVCSRSDCLAHVLGNLLLNSFKFFRAEFRCQLSLLFPLLELLLNLVFLGRKCLLPSISDSRTQLSKQ